MKTLCDPNITVTGDSITICAKIKDLPFNEMLTTRVSHLHLHPDNVKHPRRIQSSNCAVFLESRAGKLAIPNDFIAAIGAFAMPESSFPPKFKSNSSPNGISVVSETPVSFQWQISDNPHPESDKPDTAPPPAVWADIQGANGEKLDDSTIPTGKWVRCIAENLSGKTISPPIKKQ